MSDLIRSQQAKLAAAIAWAQDDAQRETSLASATLYSDNSSIEELFQFNDTAQLEQADMLDNAYLNGDSHFLVNSGYPEEHMKLSKSDQYFVSSWFKYENDNPKLFGYLLH